LTWADGALVVQGAFLAPSGEIKAEYWVVPAELNRIAYVDGKGDLWVARADGGEPQRILRGDYTLPAWSDDGRAIAVAERKDGGRRWEISIAYLPEALRTPPRPASIAEPPAMP